MAGLRDFLPVHAWLAALLCLAVAILGFFVGPAVGAALGLEGIEFVLAVGFVELFAALGIAAVFIHYRAEVDPEEDGDEWRYEP